MKLFDIAILCGGKATRLYPITKEIPKSMININGKPFIDHQLRLLEKSGFKHVILCLGNLGYQIEKYVCEQDYKLEIDYCYDGGTLLGTGGAIRNCLDYIKSLHFFVLYGDSYLPNVDYKKIQDFFKFCFYLNSCAGWKKRGLITIYKNLDSHYKNNILFENHKIVEYDKNNTDNKNYIDYGISILGKPSFWEIDKEQFDLSEVYRDLISKDQMLVYKVNNRFYEIGSLEGIQEFEKYIKERDNG